MTAVLPQQHYLRIDPDQWALRDHACEGRTKMPESVVAPKRACDQCHRRKVKCEASDAPRPCKNCRNSLLDCTYNSVPQKKGPKGSRAKVISEIREHQRRSSFSSRSWVQTDLETSPTSPSPGRTDVPTELISSCIEFFFINVYPTQPILERSRLQKHISEMSHSAEAYCLIVSLCAYMLIQPGMQIPVNLDDVDCDVMDASTLGKKLLADVIEARKSSNYVENPSIATVQTSFFLFGCYFNLENHTIAWFHLRESTTFAILLGMHQEQSYQGEDAIDTVLKRHLFWLLFVTERAYALQAQRPLSLHASIDLPDTRQHNSDTTELTGFIHLINLFRPFDNTFVGLWNQSIDVTSADWISKLQDQLTDALPRYLRSTETQAVDLRTSQQWLRVMVWQLSISHRLLSSTASNESLTFKYPMELSRQLAAEISSFSQPSMEVHGIGLVKKVFDVACTLIDVMSCVPIQPQSLELEPRDFLHQFIQLISRLRGGRERYLPLLLSKVDDSLPRLPGGGSVPHGLPSLPSSIDGQFVESGGSSVAVQEDSTDSSYQGSTMGPPTFKTEEYSDLISNSPYSTNPGGRSPYDDSSLDVTFTLQHQSSYTT